MSCHHSMQDAYLKVVNGVEVLGCTDCDEAVNLPPQRGLTADEGAAYETVLREHFATVTDAEFRRRAVIASNGDILPARFYPDADQIGGE